MTVIAVIACVLVAQVAATLGAILYVLRGVDE